MALARRSSPMLQFAVVFLTIVTAPAAFAGQLTATWTDNSGGLAAFEIERRAYAGADAVFKTIADVPRGVRSYVDRQIIEGVKYCYRVKAYNAFGDSPYSAEACGAATVSTHTISIRKAGTGTGTVTGYAILCGAQCSATYPAGKPVTLVASPGASSRFVGWSGGGCSGVSACVVTGNTNLTITATFGQRLGPIATLPRDIVTPYTLTALLPGVAHLDRVARAPHVSSLVFWLVGRRPQ